MILITGGAGYIGSHLVLKLLKQNENVIVYDNLINSTLRNLEKINKTICKRSTFYFVKGDVRDVGRLEKLFKRFNITKVIHLAALKSIPNSFKDDLEYLSVNEAGSEVVFNLAVKYSVQTIIFSSSASVYASVPKLKYSEDDLVCGTSSPYAKSKLTSEQHLHSLKKKDMSIDIIILRYFNPVGLDGSGILIEENLQGCTLFAALMDKISTKGYFEIYGRDYMTMDGTAIRDYIHVNDLVDVHLLLMNQKVLDQSVRIYNVGSGIGYSVKQVIDQFNWYLTDPINFIYKSSREGDLPRSVADASKLTRELNWSPQYKLKDMISSTLLVKRNMTGKYYD